MEAKPAELRLKDRDARWTVKFTKAKPKEDGAMPPVRSGQSQSSDIRTTFRSIAASASSANGARPAYEGLRLYRSAAAQTQLIAV